MSTQDIFTKRFNLELDRNEMSKSVVAERIGVNKSTISRYSKGLITPNISALVSICTLFGCTSDYLLGVDSFDRQTTTNPLSVENLDISLRELNNLSGHQIDQIISFIEFQIEKNRKNF